MLNGESIFFFSEKIFYFKQNLSQKIPLAGLKQQSLNRTIVVFLVLDYMIR